MSIFEENAINSVPGKDTFSTEEIKKIILNIEKFGQEDTALSEKEKMAILFLRTAAGRFLTKNNLYELRYKVTQKRIKEMPFPIFSKEEQKIILDLVEWSKKIKSADEQINKYTNNHFSSDKVFEPIHFIFIERMMDLSSTKLSFMEEIKKMNIPSVEKDLLFIVPFLEELKHPHNPVRNNMMLLGIRGGVINPEIAEMIDKYINIDEFRVSDKYKKEKKRLEEKRERRKIKSTLVDDDTGTHQVKP